MLIAHEMNECCTFCIDQMISNVSIRIYDYFEWFHIKWKVESGGLGVENLLITHVCSLMRNFSLPWFRHKTILKID